MKDSELRNTRRDFIRSLAAGAVGLNSALGQSAAPERSGRAAIALGMDNFAVRAMGWKAGELIDYAASLRLDCLFITDLFAFERHETPHLQDLRRKAADHGLQICLGSWSVCPSSRTFKRDWGSAEEHLALGIRMASDLGSPVFRVILGSRDDRRTPGGIEARIRDTVEVCRKCRSQALDAGVKIAVENHAGDMQARELVSLIEEAGRDYVGANMDSGNATWAMEHPLDNLEVLGPYAVSTSLRDSAVWETSNGVTIQWTAMGQGDVDQPAYFRRYAELCPSIPVNIETISGFNWEIAYLKPEFWDAYPKMRAVDFARFLVLAKKGKARDPWRPPAGVDRKQAEQAYQKAELERSVAFCRETLGLGLKG